MKELLMLLTASEMTEENKETSEEAMFTADDMRENDRIFTLASFIIPLGSWLAQRISIC